MLSEERGRRGSLGRVMASYRQPGYSLDGHSAKWDFRKHQLCLCYHFCGLWLLNILSLKVIQWKSVFNFHSVSLFNCILFLPFSSIAVVLLITHVFLLLEPLGDHFFSFFLFSLKLQNCLPFLRLSIAVVLWMAHPAGEFRQRLFCWKCAFIVCDFSLALQIKL